MLDPRHAACESLMSVVRLTEQVLRYHGVACERGDRLILTPYRQAMTALCARLKKDPSGLQALDQMQALLPPICTPDPGEEAAKDMQQAAAQYQSWLRTNFQRECGSVCKWPILKAILGSVRTRCEQCGSRSATVHLSQWSADGVVRHEYCGECYRMITAGERSFGRP